MKCLVTGGAGFIGSHLCEALLAGGEEVVALDNLSTGRRRNVEHLEANPHFRLVVDSVINAEPLERLVREADVVLHLASAVGVKLIIDQPVQTIETIVEGTERVLRFAARYRRRVLITSSSEVYGKGSKIPFAESDDTVLGPTTMRRWAYACSKMLDEFLALAHWHETQLPTVCVRLFNTVGPRQTGQYGMVLPTFVSQALHGEPLTVYGDGAQSRCFCHVRDVVDAMIKLINCPAAFGRVVNVGASDEISMNDLAQRVIEIAQSKSPIAHVPYETAYIEGFEDMRRRVPDLRLARELVGYAPRASLSDMIRDVIADIRASIGQNATR